MSNTLLERMARAIAATQGQPLNWPIFLDAAKAALAETAVGTGIPVDPTEIPPSVTVLRSPRLGLSPAQMRLRDHADHERQGSGYDPGAVGHELIGRDRAPTDTASIAGRGMTHPETLSLDEIQSVCASALAQVA